ncbi:MAG TPA: pitrilysin family protein [Frankiaceae bacterium]|nr:pitrilysin family protein [Frankiaceae bacterium]
MTSSTSAAPTLGPSRNFPVVVPPGEIPLARVAERTLASGLRILAVRRAAVPTVELRLRIPLGVEPERPLAQELAEMTLLGETALSGTAERTRTQLAADLQSLGASLSVNTDADRLAVIGSGLAPELPRLLSLLAEVVHSASYPEDEVVGERGRLVAELGIARSQPAVLAREALLLRLHGGHPYGTELPEPGHVAGVEPSALRTLHRRVVSPVKAVLTLVGDIDPDAAVDTAAETFASWSGDAASEIPEVPPIRIGGLTIVDRPGAVQTNIRFGGAALPRTDPRFAAQQVANVIFGGYFSSRLVSNIREDKGYTYSPRSGVEHALRMSRLTVAADAATEITAPALLEILYELGRISVLSVAEDELEAARQYAMGSLALSTSTSSGLASTLSVLAGSGIGPEYLRDHPAALARVTTEDVLAVAASVLAPARLVPVLLGDRERIEPFVSGIAALDAQEPVLSEAEATRSV